MATEMAQNHVAVIFAFLYIVPEVYAASFFGNSHIIVPFQDSSTITKIELRFKTTNPDGLLVLAAGETDFLSVVLTGGIVQLEADFGSGEILLSSLAGSRFDDKKWHQVIVSRRSETIQLQVDGVLQVQSTNEEQLQELDIQNGIFLGGTGRHKNPSNTAYKNFRGCLSNVVFNQYDILSAAQKLNDQDRIYRISWTCDEQFDALTEDPITFMSNTSFITLPHLHINTQGTLLLDVKTKYSDGLLAFNVGHESSANEIVAIEVINKSAQLTVNRGGKDIILKSKSILSDGHWHQIKTLFFKEKVQFFVDNEVQEEIFEADTKASFRLTGHLFVGGINSHAQRKAFKRNLKSAVGHMTNASSLIGCVRDIQVNSHAFGLPEVQVSKDVQAYCKWTFPCKDNPCQEGALCMENGSKYKCVCDSDDCKDKVEVAPSQSDIQNNGRTNTENTDEVQLVVVHPLEVMEGGKKVVTTENIRVVFDRRAYRIRESAIQFHIVLAPRHGRIDVDLSRRRNTNVFTLLDINGGKISYIHDGSETRQDQISIEMDIVSSSENMPARLIQKYAFILPVTISPENDASVVNVLNNGHLKIVKNTKICISKKVIKVEDPDTRQEDIVFTVQCEGSSEGFFERSSDIGHGINTFSQQEVNNQEIWYVNNGEDIASCLLKVSDGSVPVNDVTLTIQAVSLKLKMLKNTGEKLVHGSSFTFNKEILSARTNVPDQDLEIRYQITQRPKHGIIQRHQTAEETWITVDSFAQRQVNQGKIRYIHTDTANLQGSDQFSFVINCLDQRIQQQAFIITLESIKLNVVTPNTLRIHKGSYKPLTSSEVWVMSNNDDLLPAQISFILLRAPVHGNLFLAESGKQLKNVFSENAPLHTYDTFTLQNIEDGSVIYKLNRNYYQRRDDFIDLRISAPGAQPVLTRIRVEFVPEQRDVRFVNNMLSDVMEGGQRAIERSDLYLETVDYREYEYSIKNFPKHGTLQIINPRTRTIIKSNITNFTNQDIRNLKLVYKHDDSESSEDNFVFTALPIIQNKNRLPMQVQEFSGIFRIKILMINDNAPVRDVDKVFEVVTNRQRVITLNDLKFTDPDIDFDPLDLTISRHAIPNGDIVFTGNESQAYQFSQRDIADGNVNFKHAGASYSRVVIWASDGQYFTTGLLEVQASEPKVTISTNTGILVRKGQVTPITTNNISVETNVDVKPSSVRFVMIEEPLHGNLIINDQEVTEFSLADLQQELLEYKHKSKTTDEDMFKFAVVAGDAQVQGNFPIRIYVESQKHPPRVVHNEILPVVETGSAVIKQEHLLVTHPDSLPATIVYTVRIPASHGEVFVGNIHGDHITFTQADVNEGRVRYHHTDRLPGNDDFTFDVSNGQQTLRGLEFVIQILPSSLRLLVQNFTIREGARKPLTPSILRLQGPYYANRDITYMIVQQPQSGRIENVRTRGIRLSTFSSSELQQGSIFYVHDNSEETSDQMKVQARLVDEKKDSDIKTIFVTVETVNDQAPQVTVNNGMEVWKNSITQITSNNLKAEDADSPAEALMFTITQPTNGHVALLNNTFKQITNFTQALLNSGQVVFVHKGDIRGEFNFFVSDGVYGNSQSRKFLITSKELMLELVHNQQLNVYPARTQLISHDHLFTRTNNPNQAQPIIYNIQTKPRKGRIVTMFKGRALEVTSFKQDDIDENKIFYEHTNQAHGWSEVDLFFFEVTTLYAEPLTDEMFDINISYRNLLQGELGDFIQINNVAVTEGGRVEVNRENVDASDYIRQLRREGQHISVAFVLDTLPKHGQLLMEGRRMQKGEIFQQEKINSGKVMYQHDDSETVFDSFLLVMNVQNQEEPNRKRDEDIVLTVNITVSPVNDQPFEVITRNPAVDVVQGQMSYITSDDLKTIDYDTPPGKIIYNIETPPNNGYLAYINDPEIVITRFSQKDVDDRKIIFAHDGRRSSDSFRFQVSDGKFAPLTKVFVINVLPLTLDFIGNKTIWLLQGDMEVVISTSAVNVVTNGLQEKIRFNVTKETMFGTLYVDNIASAHFSQIQINQQLVLYRQTDLTVYMDYFMCTVYYPGSDRMLRGQRVTVLVKPLVKQRPLLTPSGGMVLLSTKTLDASLLANKTGNNPEYKIVGAPKYGRLVYHLRTKRETRSSGVYTPIDRFSHEDVKDNKVFYIPDESLSLDKKRDSFTYILNAKGVQPAKGTFRIRLNSNKVKNFTPSGTTGEVEVEITTSPFEVNETSKNPRKLEVKSPSVSDDFIIVIAVLIPLCIVVIIIVIVYVVWKKKHQQGDYLPGEQKNLRPLITGPVGLEQPHVHIEPKDLSPSTDEENNSQEKKGPLYYNVPSVSVNQGEGDRESHTAYCDSMHHSELSPHDWELQVPLLNSQKTEVSTTVPECKVTPLADNEDGVESSSPAASNATKSNTSLDLYNWSLSDPEFLQHCRTSNPVLRDNQYWV